MPAIFECLECGHQAIYTDHSGDLLENDLTRCPECGDVHVDVTYDVPIAGANHRRLKALDNVNAES